MSNPRISVRRIGAFGASFLAACALAACSLWPSDDQPAPPSFPVSDEVAQSEPEYEMQSGYRVGPDGKLLPPEDLPEEPKLPKAAEEDSDQGSTAFVKYYLELENYAWNTGQTEPLRANSTDECEMCQDLARLVNEHYEGGNWADGFDYRIKRIDGPAPYPQRSECNLHVVHFDQKPAVVYHNGKLIDSPEVAVLMEIHTCYVDSQWKTIGGGAFTDEEN